MRGRALSAERRLPRSYAPATGKRSTPRTCHARVKLRPVVDRRKPKEGLSGLMLDARTWPAVWQADSLRHPQSAVSETQRRGAFDRERTEQPRLPGAVRFRACPHYLEGLVHGDWPPAYSIGQPSAIVAVSSRDSTSMIEYPLAIVPTGSSPTVPSRYDESSIDSCWGSDGGRTRSRVRP